MANNFTQFSTMLPVPDDEQAVEDFLEAWEAEAEETEADPSEGWYEIYDSFEYEYRPQEGVWVHDRDGNGDVDGATCFIQSYLQATKQEKAVYLSWANTCSKPRLHEFDGGGAVITSGSMFFVNSTDVIKLAERAGVEVCNR